jgi:hypothetical protein
MEQNYSKDLFISTINHLQRKIEMTPPSDKKRINRLLVMKFEFERRLNTIK